jgi:hypothetical protein
MSKIISSVLNHVIENNKIKIPEWVKKVKIDVGLSVNAPNSEIWINNDPELCVFGFEPNIYNIKHLSSGDKIWPIHLNPKKINKSFFLINSAVSNYISVSEDFYCTEGDSGTSSLFKPSFFGIKEKIKIPVITLEYFFDMFPWDRIPHIDQIKIDAQSSDFNIIKGMGNYLSERIIYLDVETTTRGQYHNLESPNELRSYLEKNGFDCISWVNSNATFINKKFGEIRPSINYSILGE